MTNEEDSETTQDVTSVRVQTDPTTGEYHLYDGDELALSLSFEEACQVARQLPRMRRGDALVRVSDLLTTYDLGGQTGRVMLFLNELAKLVA